MIENDLLNDIENGKANVLIIFDSFDEIQQTFHDQKIEQIIDRILEKSYLKEAKVIVTCRSSADECELSDWADCTMKVQGFSEKSISEYFKTTLEGQSVLEEIMEIYKKNINVFSLCHVPQYAFVVVCCMFNKDCIGLQQKISSMMPPSTVTKLYVHIFRYCVVNKGCVQVLEAINSEFCLKDEDIDPYQSHAVIYVVNEAFKEKYSDLEITDFGLLNLGYKLLFECTESSRAFGKKKSICIHCLSKYKDLNEFLKIMNFRLFVSLHWHSETLRTLGHLIKHSKRRFISYWIQHLVMTHTKHSSLSCQKAWKSWLPYVFLQDLMKKTCIIMMEVCQKYDEITGDNSLYKVIALFEPFPINMDFKDSSWINQVDFSFLWKYLNVDTCPSLDRFIIGTLLNSSKDGLGCYKYICQYVQQSRNVTLSDKQVFVSCRWNKEILKKMINLAQCFLAKADIILDSIFNKVHDFICCVSCCLDKISSIRFPDGWNDTTFQKLCMLLYTYEELKDDNSLPQFISLFAPFSNNVPLAELDKTDVIDFSF
ncbi:uncharacterized protein LOC120522452 [Polypterus senegalus]|uniref:uncharacterized protein LOC120522452 n=1 Tax=Polypterus senegalus TaxID=55291 RepID=UPI001966B41E|nr:uncharacterized protein LOC120522452 [Polypterus senegalus]